MFSLTIYDVWIVIRAYKMICCDVPYFLWNGARPQYEHMYIINGRVTSNKLDIRSNITFLMAYADTAGVILYYKLDQPFYIYTYHTMHDLMNRNPVYTSKKIILMGIYNFNNISKVFFKK